MTKVLGTSSTTNCCFAIVWGSCYAVSLYASFALNMKQSDEENLGCILRWGFDVLISAAQWIVSLWQ